MLIGGATKGAPVVGAGVDYVIDQKLNPGKSKVKSASTAVYSALAVGAAIAGGVSFGWAIGIGIIASMAFEAI